MATQRAGNLLHTTNGDFNLALDDIPYFLLQMLVLMDRLSAVLSLEVDKGHILGMNKSPGPTWKHRYRFDLGCIYERHCSSFRQRLYNRARKFFHQGGSRF
ncbi:MAG: hypothetical protein AABN33_21615 [Acidobacteriota bacterium]